MGNQLLSNLCMTGMTAPDYNYLQHLKLPGKAGNSPWPLEITVFVKMSGVLTNLLNNHAVAHCGIKRDFVTPFLYASCKCRNIRNLYSLGCNLLSIRLSLLVRRPTMARESNCAGFTEPRNKTLLRERWLASFQHWHLRFKKAG